MMTDTQRIEEVYVKLFQLIDELSMTGNHRLDEVAGVLMAQGMRMYKMILDESDFEKLMTTIWEAKDSIEDPKEIVLH